MTDYTNFAERMRLRIKRDITDCLNKDNKDKSITNSDSATLDDNPLSPNSKFVKKKRTYEEAFGKEPEIDTPVEMPKKRKLLSSIEVLECGTVVNDYIRGI